eukprot:scaffold1907_cov185-Alexandrium_tamarense.AAC.9
MISHDQSNFVKFRQRLFRAGPDYKTYYHELFLRGRPDLSRRMRRLVNPGKRLRDKSTEPNLYEMSLMYPLPEIPGSNITLNDANSIQPFAFGPPRPPTSESAPAPAHELMNYPMYSQNMHQARGPNPTVQTAGNDNHYSRRRGQSNIKVAMQHQHPRSNTTGQGKGVNESFAAASPNQTQALVQLQSLQCAYASAVIQQPHFQQQPMMMNRTASMSCPELVSNSNSLQCNAQFAPVHNFDAAQYSSVGSNDNASRFQSQWMVSIQGDQSQQSNRMILPNFSQSCQGFPLNESVSGADMADVHELPHTDLLRRQALSPFPPSDWAEDGGQGTETSSDATRNQKESRADTSDNDNEIDPYAEFKRRFAPDP